VADSPLLLCAYYGETSPVFRMFVHQEFSRFDNLNFFLERKKPYQQIGRTQTEEEDRRIDTDLKAMLDFYGVPFETLSGSPETTEHIVERILARLTADSVHI